MLSKINRVLAAAGVIAGFSLITGTAGAEDSRTFVPMSNANNPTIRRVPGPCPGPDCTAKGLSPHAVGKRIVYLAFDGITLTRVQNAADEDATTNKSWIVDNSTETIGAFQTSQLSSTGGLSRSQIINRVINDLYASHADFDVEFTTTRPTSGQYNMVVFGGTCSSVTGSSGCAGIAMGDCGDFLPSNITFVFPYNLRVGDLAATASQEWAHGIGLGHTLDNYDVMYPQIQGYIPTEFGAGQVPNDGSGCGLTYQDSYQRMMETIGPRGQDVVPPSVMITSPANGATVEAGQKVTATASDASGIDLVEFRIGGESINDTTAPYEATIPGLAAGNHNIVVWAEDAHGNRNFAQVTVYVSGGNETACENNDECNDGEECRNNLCVPDNGLTGELGDICTDNLECLSGMCGTVGDESRCSQSCDDATPCPAGFECVGGAACWPSSGGGGGSGDGDGLFTCTASSNAGTGALPTALLLLGALLFARRRRR